MRYLSILTIALFFTTYTFAELPETFITNRENLKMNKMKSNATLINAKRELIKEANAILSKKELYSVTYKKQTPAGASKHDYYSLSRYAHPNPNTSDGLPYITIDGKVNPEIKSFSDSYMQASISDDVYKLGLAYYFTEDEKYVVWAKKLIKVFFINKKTKMNPNFEFSQIVKGKPNTGGATISALPFVKLIDGIQLIKVSKTWTAKDHKAIQEWFTVFQEWMLYSKKGKQQAKATNNIGTYYTVQTAVYSLFIGDTELAKQIIEKQGKERIENQIDSEGKMPLELKRATPWGYVKYTLTAFDYLVEVANIMDVDLYSFINTKGGSVEKMHQWLIPYAKGEKKWEYGENVSSNQVNIVLLRSSASKYRVSNIERYNLTYLNLLTTKLF